MIKKFTSECVGVGHPDKCCDAIADAILDCALNQDPDSFMAVEATIKDNFVLIYGEAKTKAEIDYAKIAKSVLSEVGYIADFEVVVKVSEQSNQIRNSVNQMEICAGDQGMMFGYACNETEQYLPFGYLLACNIAKKIEQLRKNKYQHIFQSDCKTQVTVNYQDDVLLSIDTILISVSHYENVSQDIIKEIIYKEIIQDIKDNCALFNELSKVIINPSGAFSLCGPFADSGTTGRKIVVDTYGGYAPIGGGCFSSKDCTKVDRTGAYYARYVAKHLVANHFCDKALIQVAYGIGLKDPISLTIDCYGSEKIELIKIYNYVNTYFDFSVGKMIDQLKLRKPNYSKYVNFGAFTHEDAPWEKVDKRFE